LSINVHLEKFEGPLALLLHLIRKNEMDVYDIEIHKITEQYLEYIRMMKDLNLELAGDFVAMAATLIHVKSKMLLPQYNEHGELLEQDDPRKELVDRLLEYERFQMAGKKLYERALLGREVFARGFKVEETAVDPLIILDEGGLFAMIGLYRRAIKKIKKNIHVVMAKTQSLASRILEIRHLFVPGQRVQFSELVSRDDDHKAKWVITFMSVLELGRLGFISLFQSDTYGAIHIDTKRTVGHDVVTQVQELETEAAQLEAMKNMTAVLTGEPVPEEIIEVQEAASDLEIDEAERQMELHETQEMSEQLAIAMDPQPEFGTDSQAEAAPAAEEPVTVASEILDDPNGQFGGGEPSPAL
jgi:segregation and condensation protein A